MIEFKGTKLIKGNVYDIVVPNIVRSKGKVSYVIKIIDFYSDGIIFVLYDKGMKYFSSHHRVRKFSDITELIPNNKLSSKVRSELYE